MLLKDIPPKISLQRCGSQRNYFSTRPQIPNLGLGLGFSAWSYTGAPGQQESDKKNHHLNQKANKNKKKSAIFDWAIAKLKPLSLFISLF